MARDGASAQGLGDSMTTPDLACLSEEQKEVMEHLRSCVEDDPPLWFEVRPESAAVLLALIRSLAGRVDALQSERGDVDRLRLQLAEMADKVAAAEVLGLNGEYITRSTHSTIDRIARYRAQLAERDARIAKLEAEAKLREMIRVGDAARIAEAAKDLRSNECEHCSEWADGVADRLEGKAE